MKNFCTFATINLTHKNVRVKTFVVQLSAWCRNSATLFCCWHFPSKFEIQIRRKSAYEAETNGGNQPENNESSFNRILWRMCHRITVSRLIHLMMWHKLLISTCSGTRRHHQTWLSHHPDLETLPQFINFRHELREVNETFSKLKVKTLITVIGLANSEPNETRIERKKSFAVVGISCRVLRIHNSQWTWKLFSNYVEIDQANKGCSSVSVIRIAISMFKSTISALPANDAQKVVTSSRFDEPAKTF